MLNHRINHKKFKKKKDLSKSGIYDAGFSFIKPNKKKIIGIRKSGKKPNFNIV